MTVTFFQVRETLIKSLCTMHMYIVINIDKTITNLCLKYFTLFLIIYNVIEHGYSGIHEKSFAEQGNAKCMLNFLQYNNDVILFRNKASNQYKNYGLNLLRDFILQTPSIWVFIFFYALHRMPNLLFLIPL